MQVVHLVQLEHIAQLAMSEPQEGQELLLWRQKVFLQDVHPPDFIAFITIGNLAVFLSLNNSN